MASKGYTTRTQIEDYLLITIDPSFYTQVDEWISAMETYIEQATGRVFIADSTASARLYDGDGSRELLIDDCVDVTEIKIGDADAIAKADFADNGIYVYPANGTPKNKIVLTALRFTIGNQNISVTGKWGYSAQVPADIMHACTSLVAGIINFAWESEGEVQSMTIGRYSVSYKTGQQSEDFNRVPETLKTYKRMGYF